MDILLWIFHCQNRLINWQSDHRQPQVILRTKFSGKKALEFLRSTILGQIASQLLRSNTEIFIKNK